MIDTVKLNGTESTWYGFILSNYSIGQPEMIVNRVQVPGRNGLLDVSKAVTGTVSYGNRQIVIALIVIGSGVERDKSCENILNEYLGETVKIEFSNLEGYFTGECVSYEKNTDGLLTTLTLSFDCYPFRTKQINITKVALTTSEQNVLLYDILQPTVPVLTVDGTCTIKYKNSTYTIAKGTNSAPFRLDKNDKSLNVSGTGNLTIEHRTEVI